MQLPNVKAAVVSEDKIVDYLLNPLHPEGAGKAQFFLSLGFRVDDWRTLANALKSLVDRENVKYSMDSAHGQKYIIEGTIETPCGRQPAVRTVWILDQGEAIPRLITAYPCKLEYRQ